MDTLSWTNLNPTVKRVGTKKKFFGRFLNKIVVWCPAVSIVYDKHETDAAILLERKLAIMHNRRNTYYSYTMIHKITDIEKYAVIEQLQYFMDLKNANNDAIKIRIEDPAITIYSDDLNLLYKIAADMNPERLREVHTPANDYAAEALNRGEIIIKKPMEFEYKIMLKETMMDQSTKHNILDYLYNLDKNDEVCLTKSLVKNLRGDFTYFQGGYFYAKDEQTVTFIGLICPGIISGIFKLTKLEP